MMFLLSLSDLVKTLVDLCGKSTTVVMCYEERTTGNKPEVERKFFEVRTVVRVCVCVCIHACKHVCVCVCTPALLFMCVHCGYA